jgi:hypothetical protein
MATQSEPDPFTDEDREAASTLLLILDSVPEVPFEQVRWGRKRRRTEPLYKLKPDRCEPAGRTFDDEEKRREVEEEEEKTASPATSLCFPNSSSEEQIVTPPVKQVKKQNFQRDVSLFAFDFKFSMFFFSIFVEFGGFNGGFCS